MGNKHKVLIKILDSIRSETPTRLSNVYMPVDSDPDKLKAKENGARSRAYIHLFLKGYFGVDSFDERESWITDGPGDGGIDAYYIDCRNKTIYFIQSKFRETAENWENKEINISELLSMQIGRILDGQLNGEDGIPYNASINKLRKEIGKLNDYSEYSKTVIILANLVKYDQKDLRRIIGKYGFEIFDTKKYWSDIIFPLVSGRLTNADKVSLRLSIEGSDDAPWFMKHSVNTEFGKCDNFVVYVPIKEIGEFLYKYKNSVLDYNPRCYLGMKKQKVNGKIKSSVTKTKNNNFSLLNNGITIMAKNTTISDDRSNALVCMYNPQIINGGQTAFTLASIYKECMKTRDYSIFKNKSVLVRIININDRMKKTQQLKLIESVSRATNEQTPVAAADKCSNDQLIVDLQEYLLDAYGVFLRRKQGEFSEGEDYGYISDDQLINIDIFMRVACSASGDPTKARRSGDNVIFNENNIKKLLSDNKEINKYMFAYFCYRYLFSVENALAASGRDKYGSEIYGYALRYAKYAVVCASAKSFDSRWQIKDYNKQAKRITQQVLDMWLDFETTVKDYSTNEGYFSPNYDYDGYYKGKTLNQDIATYSFN